MLDNSLAVFAGHYMSGPVKFDEKSKIVKLVGNHSYYFQNGHMMTNRL